MKQYHFTQGSCSTPGSTTWRSRPFYCEKIRSNPRSPWYIWWLLNENHTFWGVFKVSFLPCFQNLFKISIFVSEFWFIAFILIIFFQIFGGSKHAILGKNRRTGSRTWRSRPFYCEKIRSNPCSPWYIWWLFNKNHTFWGVFKVSFLPCFQNLFKISIFVSEFWFIAFILIIFFQIFGGSKHAILGKNRRTGSRSGSRSRAWTKTFF